MNSLPERLVDSSTVEIPEGYIKQPVFTKKNKTSYDETIDLISLNNFKEIPLTEDRGVIKYVQDDRLKIDFLRKGTKVNIVMDLYFPDGILVPIEGRNRKEKISFKIKDLNICPALDIAASSLSKGEKAIFKVNSEYHKNGMKGTSSVLKEDTFLYYKIELTHLETPSSLDPDATSSDLIIFLADCKKNGNSYFSNQEYEKSAKEYKKGINVLESLPKKLTSVLNESEKQEIANLEILLKNNTAMSLMKMENYRDAIKLLNSCVDKDPKNIKAWYRLALCYKYVGDYQQSEINFLECCKLDPSMNDQKREFIKEAESSKKKNQMDEKKIYEKIFQKLPEEEEREIKEQREKKAIERKLARNEKHEEDSYK